MELPDLEAFGINLSHSPSSVALKRTPDKIARRTSREPVDAVKEGDFEHEKKAFLTTYAVEGSFSTTF